MRKVVLFLTAIVIVAVGVAIVLRHDLQRERTRADALAERVAEFEPVERPSSSTITTSTENTRGSPPAPIEPTVEHERVKPASTEITQPEPKKTHRGSRQAREQVERLQIALAGGTPLQEYQIQALMTAIDRVRVENEGTNGSGATGAEMNDRLVQAADDILFESQLETFIELLNRDSASP